MVKNSSWRRLLFWILGGSLVALGVFFTLFATYLSVVSRTVDRRMAQIKSARATKFYALYPPFRIGQRLSEGELRTLLLDQGYLENTGDGSLGPREFRWRRAGGSVAVDVFRPPFREPGREYDRLRARLIFQEAAPDLTLTGMVRMDDQAPLEVFENLPKRIGTYFGGRARVQDTVPLSEIPAVARLAIMAIEDVHFLDHPGVSVRGILRALIKDIQAMSMVEGGSTLTQQLMKNLYFSSEKSLSRKLKEAIYALVTESRHSKEDILEAYLNEVYLGQAGSHPIHGFSEGARYFFNRPISQLSLSQAATLAAIVQAPNTKGPHQAPERAVQRRNLVLKKMREVNFISPEEYEAAIREPLGVTPKERASGDVFYALDLVLQRLPDSLRSRLEYEPYTIYVTLNPYLQSLASKTLSENLERLKQRSAHVAAKEKQGVHLQSALLAVSVKDCTVLALQGGRSYRSTQFNRVVQGKRQPGSLFKPFVYLTAFMEADEKHPYTPTMELVDEPFEWRYDKQVWAPRNYDNKFRGPLTLREALEQSLNVPTAKLIQMVGVSKVRDTMIRAGITSPIPAVPSISLGAADVTPLELAEAYTTFANLGRYCRLRPYLSVYDESGNEAQETKLYWNDTALPAGPTFQVVNILKGVFTHGSARSALGSGIPLERFAGKTGTTNDGRDAWFVGFSPDLLVLVWVGYDEQEKLGIPGAGAALPLWVNFVKNARLFLGNDDFPPPDGLEAVRIDRLSRAVATDRCPETVVDYFPDGLEPRSECALDHPPVAAP